MKNIINIILCILFTFQVVGQVPDLQIKDTLGNFINLPDYLENNKNYALIIWSAQDPPSTAALDDYHNYHNDWVSNYNMEFIIVSIDEENMHDGVIDFVNQQGWQYSLFFAPFTAIMQAFGISAIPYIYLIDANHDIVFEAEGWLQGDLLDQEISELFTVGLKDHSNLKGLQVYSSNKNLIIEMETVQPFLTISLFTVDGNLFFQKSYDNNMSDRLHVETGSIPIGTLVIAKIENNRGDFITKKVMIK